MDDIKVKGYPGLYRRDGTAIVNKDCNYQSAIDRLKKQSADTTNEQRIANLEMAVQEILFLLKRKYTNEQN